MNAEVEMSKGHTPKMFNALTSKPLSACGTVAPGERRNRNLTSAAAMSRLPTHGARLRLTTDPVKRCIDRRATTNESYARSCPPPFRAGGVYFTGTVALGARHQ